MESSINRQKSWQVDSKLINQIIEAQITYTATHSDGPKVFAESMDSKYWFVSTMGEHFNYSID